MADEMDRLVAAGVSDDEELTQEALDLLGARQRRDSGVSLPDDPVGRAHEQGLRDDLAAHERSLNRPAYPPDSGGRRGAANRAQEANREVADEMDRLAGTQTNTPAPDDDV
ncbi:MAG: hypothetical protein GY708_16010 [Actinomycetia bacterium]|nr:hypothetical protein [Actinomycetes bacterium]